MRLTGAARAEEMNALPTLDELQLSQVQQAPAVQRAVEAEVVARRKQETDRRRAETLPGRRRDADTRTGARLPEDHV